MAIIGGEHIKKLIFKARERLPYPSQEACDYITVTIKEITGLYQLKFVKNYHSDICYGWKCATYKPLYIPIQKLDVKKK